MTWKSWPAGMTSSQVRCADSEFASGLIEAANNLDVHATVAMASN